MSPRTRFLFTALSLLLLPFLGACKVADLIREPKPDDPLDGYEGSLAEAGVNTELDFGPKQEYLLSGYKTLREEQVKLEQRLKDLLAENLTLKTQLGNEGDSLQKERVLRTQSDAEVQKLQQRNRELEARILALGIEKSKLEQEALRSKIAALQRELEEYAPVPTEAAATPPGGR